MKWQWQGMWYVSLVKLMVSQDLTFDCQQTHPFLISGFNFSTPGGLIKFFAHNYKELGLVLTAVRILRPDVNKL